MFVPSSPSDVALAGSSCPLCQDSPSCPLLFTWQMLFLSFVKTHLDYDFIDEGFSPIPQTIEHLQPHPNPALDQMPCSIVPVTVNPLKTAASRSLK